jgi:hypothetical protein
MRPLTTEETKQWIMLRQGKPAILYPGLLHLAHEEGLIRISTKVVQLPDETNGGTAVMTAEAVFAATDTLPERSFSGVGDANVVNVGKSIVPHIIRMAETRAKARALRDALDVGYVAADELGDDTESVQVMQIFHDTQPVPQAPGQQAGSPTPKQQAPQYPAGARSPQTPPAQIGRRADLPALPQGPAVAASADTMQRLRNMAKRAETLDLDVPPLPAQVSQTLAVELLAEYARILNDHAKRETPL